MSGGQIVFPGHATTDANATATITQPTNTSEDVDSGNADETETFDSNEALPLISDLKRRRITEESPASSASSNSDSKRSATSPNFPFALADFKPSEVPIDTENLIREIRIALRLKGMRQTDLAPYIGCRPGSVAGVIAKSALPWSQLNEFNRSVFTAMAKWLEAAKNSQQDCMMPIALRNVNNLNDNNLMIPAIKLSPIHTPPNNTDLLNNLPEPALPSSSNIIAAPVIIPPPVELTQPWASAKCTISAGYMLFLENLNIAVPGRGSLFQGANLSIAVGKRYGLFGPSECGTSTLLKFIAAKQNLNIPVFLDIVLCDQSNLDSAPIEDLALNQRTVDFVLQAERRWAKLKAEETLLETIVRRGDTREAFHRLRQVYEQLCFIGSGAAETKARQLLTGLGFNLQSQDGSVRDLTARGRKVALLAQALLAEPALLMIDRPTNFLDVESVVWLETYLKNWPTCLLIVSQDRNFMDAVCSAIIYVHGQKLFYYQGNYTKFKEQISQK